MKSLIGMLFASNTNTYTAATHHNRQEAMYGLRHWMGSHWVGPPPGPSSDSLGLECWTQEDSGGGEGGIA